MKYSAFGVCRYNGAGLESALDGTEDAQELIVVDMLREVERERGVELIRMIGAEAYNVRVAEAAVSDAARVPPPLRCTHEGLGEIDAHVVVHARPDDLEQNAVAAPEIGDDLAPGELDERQQTPYPLDSMRVILVDVALVISGEQFFIRQTTGRLLRHDRAASGRSRQPRR
jgi:hypothetical protein